MKNFNKIYEEVYKECNAELENLRKKSMKKTIIFMIIFIIISLSLGKIFAYTMFIMFAIPAIILFSFRNKERKRYNSLFKSKVIRKFIKEYNEELDYRPSVGMPYIIYAKANFEPHDKYRSEDLIVGVLEGGYPIKMAEVKTEVETPDGDGGTTTHTVFYGLFAEIKLNKTINASMRIRKNNIFFSKKDKLEMDSAEFEKKFNVFSTNKIIAMQLLTADIMELFMEFIEENKIIPEITLEGNHFYIRFQTGNIFEAKLMKKALDYSMLKKYFDIINFTLTLTEKFLKNINETEI